VAARLARLTNLVDLYRYLGGGWIEHTGDVPRPADDIAAPRNESHRTLIDLAKFARMARLACGTG